MARGSELGARGPDTRIGAGGPRIGWVVARGSELGPDQWRTGWVAQARAWHPNRSWGTARVARGGTPIGVGWVARQAQQKQCEIVLDTAGPDTESAGARQGERQAPTQSRAPGPDTECEKVPGLKRLARRRERRESAGTHIRSHVVLKYFCKVGYRNVVYPYVVIHTV